MEFDHPVQKFSLCPNGFVTQVLNEWNRKYYSPVYPSIGDEV